jgi:hypothetical protein
VLPHVLLINIRQHLAEGTYLVKISAGSKEFSGKYFPGTAQVDFTERIL